jgi:predicted transcriptional regulator
MAVNKMCATGPLPPTVAGAIIQAHTTQGVCCMNRTIQLHTSVDEATAAALDRLAHLTGRTRDRLVEEAITAYITQETQVVREVEEARASIRAGDYYDLADVVAELDALIAQAASTAADA